MQRRKWLLTVARFSVAGALLAWLAFSGVIDWHALTALLDARTVVATLALASLGHVLTCWRLTVLLVPLGFRLTVPASVRLGLIGVFFNTCLPGGASGDAVRIYYGMSENRGRRLDIATAMLLDRMVGLAALLMWPVLAATAFPGLVRESALLQGLLILLGGGSLAVLLVLMLLVSGSGMLGAFAARLSARWAAARNLERAVEVVQVFGRARRRLLAAFLISLMAHTLAFSATLVIAHAVTPRFAWEMALLLPAGFLANALPLTPGGLGVGEAALDGLFRSAGLDGGAEILLGWRFAILSLALAGLAVYLRGQRRFIFDLRAPADVDEPTLVRARGAMT
jgi:hypothetical protein